MGNSQAKQDQQADVNGETSSHNQHEQDHEHGAHAEGQYLEYQYTEKDLEFVQQKEQDEAYGEIKIFKIKVENEQDGENPQEELEICTKTKIFDSKDYCKDYQKDIQAKQQLSHPHLVRLIKSQAIINSNFCTNIYKIDMAYEYVKHNLKTEILNRFESKEYFEEQTIYDLIDQVMKCLSYLKSQGIIHGDIQPKTILIDNYGNFKLTDINFLTAGMCGYKKHLLCLETECFLAPELLQKLRRQTILGNDEVDYERADIFSLGLVALAMCTLQNVDCVYDFEEYTLKEVEILNLLEIVKNQYSYDLYLLLVSMLNSVEKRINYDDGIELVEQMRSGNFNLEEYEQRRYQQELEQSERKQGESALHHSQSPSKPNPNHHNHNQNDPRANQISRQSSQQGDHTHTSAASENRILDFDPDREARKRTKIQQNHQQSEQVENNNSDEPSSSFKHGNGLDESNHSNQQSQNQSHNHQSQNPQSHNPQAHNQYNSDQKKNPRSQNQLNQFAHSNNSGHQYSDAKNENHQFNHNSQHSNQKQGQSYQHMNQLHSNHNQATINDIDTRVRDALLRSQQVSIKFENSPLRLFRDQLLADELYVPIDPQFSSNNKSRILDGSGRKNQFASTNKINSSNNMSQNFSASKIGKKNNNSSIKVSQNGKWKI